jgi:hypothetical protein
MELCSIRHRVHTNDYRGNSKHWGVSADENFQEESKESRLLGPLLVNVRVHRLKTDAV